MTNNSLTITSKSAFPALSNNITYSEAAKMFLSLGYTSVAGNTYQEGLRLSKFMAVNYSIGHGYCHSFLNGVKLFIWDSNKPKLVAHRTFNCYYLTEEAINRETINLVKEHIKNSIKVLDLGNATDSELSKLSEALVFEMVNTTKLIGNAR